MQHMVLMGLKGHWHTRKMIGIVGRLGLEDRVDIFPVRLVPFHHMCRASITRSRLARLAFLPGLEDQVLCLYNGFISFILFFF